MEKSKSKYKNKIIEVDGIRFDSQIEARYYDHLKWLKESGEILGFSLQPEFILQEAFKKNGKHHQAIKYKADFAVKKLDNSIEIVDIKGFVTADFAIKKKLFEYKYPNTLKLLTFSKADGGWIETEQLKKNRKLRKKLKG